ncbi:MAG TPA: YqhR family membrane protein [Parafilimonas sp.]|nr:YqhR family membrane protein [Parafilimonas sp.]
MIPAIPTERNNKSSATKTILLTGFIAGTLDILAAFFVYSFIMNVVTPLQILNGIAAGVFGKTVIGSKTVMALIGLLFHYFIAFSFTIGYFLVYPYAKFLHHNKIITGLLYGIFVWMVMNLIVLPLSNARHAPFSWVPALRGCLILMFCIGLPIALLTARHYRNVLGR